MKKSLSVELLRFLFICIICLWHYQGADGFFGRGYLAVEFFFVLSGMLLYRSFTSHTDVGTFDFTWRKFKRFWPEYFVVMCFLYICQVFTGRITLGINTVNQFVSEMFMLQGVGLWQGGRNYALWYISVLLIGGAFVYGLLRINRRLALSVVLPFVIVCGYRYILFYANGNHIAFESTGILPLPVLRGVCEMSLGVLTMHIVDSRLQSLTKRQQLVLDFLSMMSLTLFVRQTIFINDDDSYCLIFIPLFTSSLFVEGSLMNRLLSRFLSGGGKIRSHIMGDVFSAYPCIRHNQCSGRQAART